MSDLYVELLSRIPVVAEQTHLGEQRIQELQSRAGLSNEAVARVVHVSEKTWRRWKKLGAIPTASLPAVARALGFELHEVGVNEPSTPHLEELLQQVITLLEELLAQRPPRGSAAASSGRRG